MVIYNHYLAELGINKNDWPFADDCGADDPRYKADEEGFRESEFWSLDASLAMYIYSHLCYFRDYCLVGYPAGMTGEEWKEILDKMIKGFKLIIEPEPDTDYTKSKQERDIISKNRQKQINYGLRLFAKYFSCLWF